MRDPRMASRARLRLLGMLTRRPEWSPRADHRTTIADCRAALCLARGVSPDDIDPASGYDISERAYRVARESWRDYVRQHGLSSYVWPEFERAVDGWRRRRPDLAGGDDWLAGLGGGGRRG